MIAHLQAQQISLQPEPAQSIVFRSIRDQKMKGTLKLAASMDSLATEHLAAELAHQRGHSLSLDAGNVSFIGALALQLLIVAHRQWLNDDKSFQIVDPSLAFLDGIAQMGVRNADIGLPEPSEVPE
ncbi:MAG: STAS domain-containing protein [Pararhodobacter sp.]|nr:STAS domain-containing protein [Pararhodobacter sp.]